VALPLPLMTTSGGLIGGVIGPSWVGEPVLPESSVIPGAQPLLLFWRPRDWEVLLWWSEDGEASSAIAGVVRGEEVEEVGEPSFTLNRER
jgi:hypothetical protein